MADDAGMTAPQPPERADAPSPEERRAAVTDRAEAERLAEIRADLNNIASALAPEPRDAIQGIVRFLLAAIDSRDAANARLEQERDAAQAEAAALREAGDG